jgi:MoaA/NifB/PqqE/SkfB family radical SAM enzyme
MKLKTVLNHLLHVPAYITDGIFYKLAGFLFTPRPRFVCFPVTFRCNSRCQMCNIWQNPDPGEEISLTKIDEVFSNHLFKNVEEVVLHGGEPTLREDLKDIYEIVFKSCPKLKNIISSTNGLKPRLVDKRVNEILSVTNPKKINLTFTVSIDGLKDSHEKIRGIKGGFDRAVESIKVLKKYQAEYPIEVQIITVIQPQNLQDLEKLENMAKDFDVKIIFQTLMIDTFYSNSPSDSRLKFSEDQLNDYRRIIETKFIQSKDTASLYWTNFLDMMDGGKRNIPCAYDRYVLSLYPTGDVLPCATENWIYFGNVYENSVDKIWFSHEAKEIRKRMRQSVCPSCSFYCGAEYSLKKEFFTYLRYYLKTNFFPFSGIF